MTWKPILRRERRRKAFADAKASLAIIRSWPELKLGDLAPRILVLNGGAVGPWYIVAERKG